MSQDFGDMVHCSAQTVWMMAGDPNITYSRGRICKDSGSGDKWSSLIHTSSLQGERPLWAIVSSLQGRYQRQYQTPHGRQAYSQLSGKQV